MVVVTGDEYYAKLLKDPKWRAKSKKIIQRDGGICTACGSPNNLNVHHTYYIKDTMPWDYPNVDLITLCHTCHRDFHIHHEVPIKERRRKKIIRIAKETERKQKFHKSKKNKGVHHYSHSNNSSIQERIKAELKRVLKSPK